MTVQTDRQELINKARERRASQLPSEFLIPQDKLPSEDEVSVIDFPAKSGLFTKKELEITEVRLFGFVK